MLILRQSNGTFSSFSLLVLTLYTIQMRSLRLKALSSKEESQLTRQVNALE
jgi:hypothetical protein